MKKETEIVIYQQEYHTRFADGREETVAFEQEAAQFRKAIEETYRDQFASAQPAMRVVNLAAMIAYDLQASLACTLLTDEKMLQIEINAKDFSLAELEFAPFRALCEHAKSITFRPADGGVAMVAKCEI